MGAAMGKNVDAVVEMAKTPINYSPPLGAPNPVGFMLQTLMARTATSALTIIVYLM